MIVRRLLAAAATTVGMALFTRAMHAVRDARARRRRTARLGDEKVALARWEGEGGQVPEPRRVRASS